MRHDEWRACRAYGSRRSWGYSVACPVGISRMIVHIRWSMLQPPWAMKVPGPRGDFAARHAPPDCSNLPSIAEARTWKYGNGGSAILPPFALR